MKKIMFTGRRWMAALIVAASLFVVSCEKDETGGGNNDTYSLSGNGSGAQEVPANSSTGTATLTGTYNATTNNLNYNISWSNLTTTVVGAHFHGPAPIGVSAGVLVGLTVTSSGINGMASGTVTLTEAQETALLNGEVYYNIHTVTYVDGEVRGQVSASLQ
jgi:hypothetical protein